MLLLCCPGADEIQRFTFDLCHLYARCTKIVSSPAPTYYAHLAAHNARTRASVVGHGLQANCVTGLRAYPPTCGRPPGRAAHPVRPPRVPTAPTAPTYVRSGALPHDPNPDPDPEPHLTQAHYHMTNFREEYGDGKWDVGQEEAAESVFCPVVPHLQDRLYYT